MFNNMEPLKIETSVIANSRTRNEANRITGYTKLPSYYQGYFADSFLGY